MLPGMRGTISIWGAVVSMGLLLATGSGCGDDDGGSGGGTNTGGAAGGGGSGGGSGGGTPATCSGYCSTIMAACTGADGQYGDNDSCMASCSSFPAGAPGDQKDNSLECRAYHANAAKSGATHCPHAGPAGDGVCGTNCDGYCSLMMKHCAGAYPSAAECATACATITGATAKGFDTGIDNRTGDSLFCRIYHATAASMDPTTHCEHAKLNPSSACL